jgi:hypothetical protein
MADTTETASTAVKLTVATMTTMVVGGMVGAGVFCQVSSHLSPVGSHPEGNPHDPHSQ